MKKVGLAAFEDKKTAFKDLGSAIQQTRADQLSTQLSVFQSALNYFAVNHAAEIRSDPKFRREFAKMCSAIGVDPLATSVANKKGGSLWASILGKDIGDFYFELAVKVIELCRITRDANGGIISVAEVRTRLADPNQPRPLDVTEDDIERAVKSLDILGKGTQLVKLVPGTGSSSETRSGYKTKTMIRSRPSELSNDHAKILESCQVLGYVTQSMLRDNLNWTSQRSKAVLDEMLRDGLLWLDAQDVETSYWIPSWMETV